MSISRGEKIVTNVTLETHLLRKQKKKEPTSTSFSSSQRKLMPFWNELDNSKLYSQQRPFQKLSSDSRIVAKAIKLHFTTKLGWTHYLASSSMCSIYARRSILPSWFSDLILRHYYRNIRRRHFLLQLESWQQRTHNYSRLVSAAAPARGRGC